MASPVVFHPAAWSHSVRLLQDGSRGESVLLLLKSQRAREGFQSPANPKNPPPPCQAQLTLPGGAQASSSPWTLPIPKGKGQNPEPLLSVLIALPANGGEEGVSNDMPLDLCPGNILSLFFLFFKTISFYSSGWSESLTMQPSLASHS